MPTKTTNPLKVQPEDTIEVGLAKAHINEAMSIIPKAAGVDLLIDRSVWIDQVYALSIAACNVLGMVDSGLVNIPTRTTP